MRNVLLIPGCLIAMAVSASAQEERTIARFSCTSEQNAEIRGDVVLFLNEISRNEVDFASGNGAIDLSDSDGATFRFPGRVMARFWESGEISVRFDGELALDNPFLQQMGESYPHIELRSRLSFRSGRSSRDYTSLISANPRLLWEENMPRRSDAPFLALKNLGDLATGSFTALPQGSTEWSEYILPGRFVCNLISDESSPNRENGHDNDANGVDTSTILRRAFINLAESTRMEIQSVLRIYGSYRGEIDGLWGPGTEGALLEMMASEPGENSIATEDEALAYLSSLRESAYEGEEECDPCEVAPVGERTEFVAGAETRGNFVGRCIASVTAVARQMQQLPPNIRTLSDVGSVWASIGVPPHMISPSLDRWFAGGIRPAPSDAYQVTEETASNICISLSSVLEENASISRTQRLTRELYVFETSDLERERIPGNWSVPIGNYRTAGLETLLVSYFVEIAEPLRIPRCSVEFHAVHPRQEVVSEQQINDLTVLGVRFLGSVYMVVLVPNDENDFEIVQRPFVNPSSHSSAGQRLQRLIEENFSFFESDRISVEFIEQLMSDHAEELGVFQEHSFSTVSRGAPEVLQSSACIDALNLARNEYARMSR